MKKLITPLILIVAFLGVASLSYLAAQHYETYKAKQAAAQSQEQAKEETARVSEIEALKNVLATKEQETEILRGECQKGAAAYANLSAFYKRNLEAPVCGEPVAQ